MKKYHLYLASASPRRKELMEWSYLPFSIQVSSIEENSEFRDPKEYVQDLAMQKARSVYQTLNDKNAFVIGADTTVVLENEIINKPSDVEDARRILLKLSNRTHLVYTGVAFIFDDGNTKK